jgi:hypothetical protein
MAVIAHVVLEGVTKEQYDAVRAECGWLDDQPVGGLGHLAWWEGNDNQPQHRCVGERSRVRRVRRATARPGDGQGGRQRGTEGRVLPGARGLPARGPHDHLIVAPPGTVRR